MRKMYDAAYPPPSPPDVDAVAGYIGGNTPHVWTGDEWAGQKARYRLPIFVRSHDGDPVKDANASIAWLKAHNVPKGSTLALDYETRVDAAYLQAFDRVIVAAGYKTMVYGSRSFVMQNPRPSGGYWTATWNNVPHLDPGASATQYGGDVTLGKPYDLSVVADSVPLWDMQGEEEPMTDAEWRKLEGLLDKYSRYTVRWIDHGDNQEPGSGNNLAVVRKDIAAVKADVDALKPGVTDPAALADAVLAKLGPSLAAQLVNELSARLAV